MSLLTVIQYDPDVQYDPYKWCSCFMWLRALKVIHEGYCIVITFEDSDDGNVQVVIEEEMEINLGFLLFFPLFFFVFSTDVTPQIRNKPIRNGTSH